ncbi:MAG: LemA family protein [Candidatus Dojkabacteria bacterium]
MNIIVILGIVVVVVIVFVIYTYNALVTLKTNRDQSFADIDVQLKQRFDLVPNLVETVKGYATQEKTVFENVTKARTAALSAQSIDDKIVANNQLSSTLKSLFAVSEAYPDLKSNQNFLALQNELSDIENKISAARRFFNNATKEYNVILSQFPYLLIAGTFGFKNATFFDIGSDEAAREPVQVKL